jgi:hypothetical protein
MKMRKNRLVFLVFSFTALSLSLLVSKGYAQETEPPAGAGYSPFPTDKVVVTKVKHFDVMCWKIATAGGTWYFENGETEGMSGFDSAFDQAGNDWIGNDADKGYNKSPSSGGKHEYRGWPNFGEGNFDHPQRKSGAKTSWVDASGAPVTFTDKLEGAHLIMRSSNATYELEYHFFVSHAAIKVLKAGNKYAFLYEGPIGGEQEASIEKDYYVLKDGKKREFKELGLGGLDPEFKAANKFPSPFFYFADSDAKDTQVLYMAAKGTAPATAGDEGWRQGTNMVIFSYGRDEDKRAYTGTDAVSVFGFQPKDAGHEAISAFIEARLADPFNPASGGGTPTGGAGGTPGTGGTTGAGGSTGAGGATATGGATSSTGGSTATGGATASGGTTSSGGVQAQGGSSGTGNGGSSSSGGKVSSGGSTSSGGNVATGGQTSGSGGSTGKADAGTNTKSSSSGGCSFAQGQKGGALGFLLISVLGAATIWFRRRRR